MHSTWGTVVRLPSEKDKISILFNNAYYGRCYKPSKNAKKWYSYLKKNGLFKRYMDRIFELIYNGGDSFFLLYISSLDHIKRVCAKIDEKAIGNGTHFWQDRYADFYWKKHLPIINHISAAKLYKVSHRDTPHSKYVGSSELKKSLYDKIIDGFFNLFK